MICITKWGEKNLSIVSSFGGGGMAPCGPLDPPLDPFELLPSNGRSGEAEVYRQLIVERINDDDITTAFKLYCIGHYIPFCREIINGNRPISERSDHQRYVR